MWKKLCEAILKEMPFRPHFLVKYKGQFEKPVHDPDAMHWGYGWWDELGRVGRPFSDIEYLLVRGYKIKAIHKYAKPEIIDASKEFTDILERFSFDFRYEEGVFYVYGPHTQPAFEA